MGLETLLVESVSISKLISVSKRIHMLDISQVKELALTSGTCWATKMES